MASAPYYEHRGISLYYGDCREILPQLQAQSIDFALTDPPYLVSYQGRWDHKRQEILGDSDPTWVGPAFAELWRVLKQNALCLSFYGWPNAEIFLHAWKQIGFRPVSHFALLKTRMGLGYFSRSQHETAYLLAKNHPPKPAPAPSDVLESAAVGPPFHPNEKPLGALSRLIADYTAVDDCIVDPFAGSGTTLVAARNLGRRAVGVEIEEAYCEIAAMRLSQQHFEFAEPGRSAEQLPICLDSLGHSEGDLDTREAPSLQFPGPTVRTASDQSEPKANLLTFSTICVSITRGLAPREEPKDLARDPDPDVSGA
jgi:site-specific DNA-methyltransferase (adenine-specific)